ncbi:unnamed protein product [Phaedon cochleariae]|uniref:Uncharacterized protein n=1 Tax=Phaedon cochleariae TaxID=80249 RepID=A0A9N9S777_PHACE|nr:unnamed protein product [Phaedon cochleariae]
MDDELLVNGLIDVTVKAKQVCPTKLLVFDLGTDQLVARYDFPEEFVKQDSLYSNILVDVRGNDCLNVHAYLTDVWRFGLVVFSLKTMRGWRVKNVEFEWTDGIFGLALSPYSNYNPDRTLFFHPMSSFREFTVKTSVICNETGWSDVKDAFKVIGQSRGKNGQVSASRIDRNGIMFFNLVTRDSVGCWDTRKPYKRSNLGVVAENAETLVFPNDLKVDHEQRQSVWVISNKLPLYLYEGLDENQVNFRIMSAFVDEAVKNTICDPNASDYDTYQEFSDDEDCY